MEALTREQLEALFSRREASEAEMAAMSDEKREQHVAFAGMLLDLRWPVGPPSGDAPETVANVEYIAALVAYHLVRCGWRKDPEHQVIKARKVTGRGIATGAVEWVGMEQPDDPLANLENLTVRELAALSPHDRMEAIRRLEPSVTNDLPAPDSGWKVKPNISIVDQPRMPFAESGK